MGGRRFVIWGASASLMRELPTPRNPTGLEKEPEEVGGGELRGGELRAAGAGGEWGLDDGHVCDKDKLWAS